MGLFSSVYHLGKQAIIESVKYLYNTPGKIFNWTRNKVKNILNLPENFEKIGETRNKAGKKIDNSSYSTARFIEEALRNRGNPVARAEGRLGSRKCEELANTTDEVADVLGRTILPEAELAERYENRFKICEGDIIDQTLYVETKKPSPEEWMTPRMILQSINNNRRNNLTLLSSNHPMTIIANKQAKFISQNPDKETMPPISCFMYPYLQKGHKYGSEGKNAFHEIKTGIAGKNIIGNKRFYGMTKDERRRALYPPVVDEHGHYSVSLEESDEHFLERYRRATFERRKMNANTSNPLTLTLSINDPDFPEDGNPYHLFFLLKNKYPDELRNIKYSQIAIGTYQKGSLLTLTAYLTQGQPQKPETLEEPTLPDRIDSNWWYERIPKEERKDGSVYHDLYENDDLSKRFASGLSVWSYYKLNKFIETLKNDSNIDISIQSTLIQPHESIGERSHDTLHITIKYPTTNSETIKLIKGTDVLLIPSGSIVSGSRSSDNGENSSSFMRMDDYLECIKKMKNDDKFPVQHQLISGNEPAINPTSASAPEYNSDFDNSDFDLF